MLRSMLSRRGLLVVLVLGGLAPSVSFGQEQIYWSVYGQVWKMNADGTGQAAVFPAGMNVPAGFQFGDNASARDNVVGPTSDGWFFYTLEPAQTPPAAAGNEIFAFTTDGNGGAVWRQLTNFSGTGFEILGVARLPQDGSGSFVSFIVFDSSVMPNRCSIARLDAPLTRTAPAVPAEVTAIYTAVPPDTIGGYSWNPTSTAVAFRLNHLYTDGTTRPQLVVHNLTTGQDQLLVEPTTTGLSPNGAVWSPLGDKIAFVNSQWGTNEGIYMISAGGGAAQAVLTAKRGGGGFYEFYTPVWAPNASAFACWEIHSQFAWNNYDQSAVAKVTPGKKSPSVVVLTPWYPWANRAIPFGWR